jgi:cullin-associated NEDD8-dissociated protein 1
LISRFGDREETVRLEVWATYGSLLNQTAVYGSFSSKDDNLRGKRKRDSDTMDVEEGPISLLRAQVPSFSKALLNQLKSPKASPVCLRSGFSLLYSLLEVLPGSLSSQVVLITSISKSILSQPATTSTATLHLTCLSFLALFFSTHSPPTFSSSLPTLTPVLLKVLAERHPRISAETFRVFSALLNALKPVKNSDWAESVYTQAVSRLSNHDTDAEVRAAAEECIADLWICATDLVRTKDGKEWDAICRSTGNTDGAVRVVIKVASEVSVGDEWTNKCLEWILMLLRKSSRTGKPEIFVALSGLVRR